MRNAAIWLDLVSPKSTHGDSCIVLQFVLRHCNFLALTQPGGAYSELLNSVDLAMMPWLSKFQVITPHSCPSRHQLICIVWDRIPVYVCHFSASRQLHAATSTLLRTTQQLRSHG